MSGKVGRCSAFALALVLAASLPAVAAPTERDRILGSGDGSVRSRVRVPGSADTAVPAPWRPSAPDRAAVPATGFAFDAIARQGPNWPADPTGALGVHWILTAVNASYALYDLAGHPVLGPNPIGSLLPGPSGAEVSDPKVIFDPYDRRFILAYLVTDDAHERSWFSIVAIPDATATDPSTWCPTKVVADRTKGDGRQRAGSLGLGVGESHVALTADMSVFGGRRFEGSTVLGFPKARLYDCSREVAFDTFTGRETTAPTGVRGFALEPAVSVGHGRSLYLTSLDPGRRSFVILWRLSGRLGSMTLRSVPLPVPRVRAPSFGTQAGAGADEREAWWETGDLEITSTFSDLDAGRVYAAHVVAKNLGPDPTADYVESVVRWYELDPAGTLGASRVLRVGTIGASQTDAGWPSLATDDAGNLFVTYDRASAVFGEFLSAWIAEIVPGATDATTAPLRSGSARFEATAGPEPWGGSTAMSRDPVDGDAVLSVNQVAVGDGSGSTREWRQVVHIVSHAP